MIPGIVAAQRVVPASPPLVSVQPVVKYAAVQNPGNVNVTSFSVTYPADAGDLVIINLGYREPSATLPTLSTTGWSLYGGSGLALASVGRDYLYWKVCGSAETGVTFTLPAADYCGAAIFVITAGTHGSALESNNATGSTDILDIPTLTPSWGGGDNLWISTGVRTSGTTVSAHSLPDNNIAGRTSALTNAVANAGSTKYDTAASLDINGCDWASAGANGARSIVVKYG